MKFSENWLRSHVPTGASRDELSAVLTAIGLEVEDVTALGEGLDHVVVARIVDAVRHPEADRLTASACAASPTTSPPPPAVKCWTSLPTPFRQSAAVS